jgi:hypothetical protein
MLQASLEAKGLKFLLEKQTEAADPRARSGRVARCASRTAWRSPPTWS